MEKEKETNFTNSLYHLVPALMSAKETVLKRRNTIMQTRDFSLPTSMVLFLSLFSFIFLVFGVCHSFSY